MDKGDIILTPFPFSDLTGSKLRPAVLLTELSKDFIVCFITSQTQWQELTDIYLSPSSNNGLKLPSLLKTSKIATVQKQLTIGKLGRLEVAEIATLNKNLKIVLKLI